MCYTNEKKALIGKRKYITQMSTDEINTIFKRLKAVDRWNISGHALQRMEQKKLRVTYRDLHSMIHNADIIEYKIDDGKQIVAYDERVLLSCSSIVNDKYRILVVYSLTRKKIVTVWANNIADSHETLDWSLYSADMKVFDK